MEFHEEQWYSNVKESISELKSDVKVLEIKVDDIKQDIFDIRADINKSLTDLDIKFTQKLSELELKLTKCQKESSQYHIDSLEELQKTQLTPLKDGYIRLDEKIRNWAIIGGFIVTILSSIIATLISKLIMGR